MAMQQILDYIKKQVQQGASREQIKSSLMANGWQENDINEAFAQSPMPQQIQASLPGATAILGQAWSLYKQRLGTFLGVMIIPWLVLTSLLAVLAGGGFLGLILLFSKFAAGGIGLLIVLAIVFFVAIFISQAWGQTALLYAIKDSQERIGVREAYRRGWHKIFSYWWISLLAGFITIGGFLLLVVPGIIFAVWFSLAMFILIAEDLKGMNALLKSREYVKGKWGSIFWRFFFIGALSLIISLVPILVLGLLEIPFGVEISRFVIGLFLTPLVMAYSFLVYSNLKAVKGEIAFAPTGGQKTTFIIIGILGILIIPAILFLYSVFHLALPVGKQNQSVPNKQTSITQVSPPPSSTSQSASPSATEEWSTYTNRKIGVKFKYPTLYKVLKEDESETLIGIPSLLGLKEETFLRVSTKSLTDYQSYRPCFQDTGEESMYPCLELTPLHPADYVVKTELGGRSAVSFYVLEDVLKDYHIVQTMEEPKLELKIWFPLLDPEADKTFDQILSTVKFIE